MFCEFYSPQIRSELKKCKRVFPHDQNTSGFFITILTKTKEMEEVKKEETKK